MSKRHAHFCDFCNRSWSGKVEDGGRYLEELDIVVCHECYSQAVSKLRTLQRLSQAKLKHPVNR